MSGTLSDCGKIDPNPNCSFCTTSIKLTKLLQSSSGFNIPFDIAKYTSIFHNSKAQDILFCFFKSKMLLSKNIKKVHYGFVLNMQLFYNLRHNKLTNGVIF